MIKAIEEKRQAKRMDNLQKRYERLSEAYEVLKEEKADTDRELVVCRAKLERTVKYESELRETLAQAIDAKRAYDAAYKDLQVLRKQYAEQMNALIDEIGRQ